MNVKKLLRNLTLSILLTASATGINAATGSMDIGQTTIPDLTVSASGTGWNWAADTETLTLADSYGGAHIAINCQRSETVNLLYNGNITITSAEADPIYCEGSLNIDGSNGILTLKYEGDNPQYSALSAMHSLTLSSGTINASSTGASIEYGRMSAVIYASRAFVISGNSGLTARATGKDGYGFIIEGKPFEFSTTGTVTVESAGKGYAIVSNSNAVINSGTVKLSNDDNPDNLIRNNRLNVNGGVLIYNNGTPPSPTGISPASGTHNITATLSGENLLGVRRVNVNGKDANAVTSINDKQITFLTPSSEAGSSSIFVETKGGAINLKDAFTYTNTSYRVTAKSGGNIIGLNIDFFDIEENTAMEQPANNPTLEGYTFLGWYDDWDCTIERVFKDHIISKDITIYAKFITGSSIDESTSDKKIRITTSPETINIESDEDMRTVEIFDLSGKLLQSHPVNNTKTDVNIFHLSRGIYILKVSTIDGDEESFKITR